EHGRRQLIEVALLQRLEQGLFDLGGAAQLTEREVALFALAPEKRAEIFVEGFAHRGFASRALDPVTSFPLSLAFRSLKSSPRNLALSRQAALWGERHTASEHLLCQRSLLSL